MSHDRMKTAFLHFSNYRLPLSIFLIVAAVGNMVFVDFPRFL